MAISLKNFVDINIGYFASQSVSGMRNIAVLIDDGSISSRYAGNSDTIFTSINKLNDDSSFFKQGGFNTTDNLMETDNLYPLIAAFFENGGYKLHYIKVASDVTGQSIKNAIDELPVEEIMIASTCNLDKLTLVAQLIDADDTYVGINEKILVGNLHHFAVTSAISAVAELPLKQPSSQAEIDKGIYYTRDTSSAGAGYLNDGSYAYTVASVYNSENTYYILKRLGADADSSVVLPSETIDDLVVKYGPKAIEMTVLAYFTKINVYTGTISDYCFTEENVSMIKTSVVNNVPSSPIVEDDELFNKIKEKDYNCVTELTNSIVEFGGNMINHLDLNNNFIKIILTQTLTQRLVNLLKTKLRYTQVGLSKISSTLSQELIRYRNFGYLSRDKVWTEEDLYDDSGEYLIIGKGTPLDNGYRFVILPFESLTDEEKAQHLLPKIYLIIADTYSVRAIQISGLVY